MDYDYLSTGELWRVRQNGSTSPSDILATFAYDGLGRRTSLTRGNGAVTSYTYNDYGLLASVAHNFSGTTNDVSTTFTYNLGGQISQSVRNNDAYAWTGHGSGSTASVTDGLNRLVTVGGTSAAYDSRGNLTSDPTTSKTYAYSSENLLTSSTGGTSVTLTYDPLLRLKQHASSSGTVKAAYDGLDRIADYNHLNEVLDFIVYGPGVDEPIVAYDGLGNRTWLQGDGRAKG